MPRECTARQHVIQSPLITPRHAVELPVGIDLEQEGPAVQALPLSAKGHNLCLSQGSTTGYLPTTRFTFNLVRPQDPVGIPQQSVRWRCRCTMREGTKDRDELRPVEEFAVHVLLALT